MYVLFTPGKKEVKMMSNILKNLNLSQERGENGLMMSNISPKFAVRAPQRRIPHSQMCDA